MKVRSTASLIYYAGPFSRRKGPGYNSAIYVFLSYRITGKVLHLSAPRSIDYLMNLLVVLCVCLYMYL